MSRRQLTSAATGLAVFTTVAALAAAGTLTLVRLAVLGAALGAVVESDLVERRIPNRIVVPAALVCAAATLGSESASFALAEGLALALILLVLSLLRADALGMGDVKLALLLVVALDGRSALALVTGLALAASFGVILLLRYGRAGARRRLPLAPFFAAGALIAVLA
jgi:leader peptidase (prepilin peptidase)/N-methyltransferase